MAGGLGMSEHQRRQGISRPHSVPPTWLHWRPASQLPGLHPTWAQGLAARLSYLMATVSSLAHS